MTQGFIPYAQCPDADKVTVRHQTGSRSGRRKHAVLEARNYICAHVKRNDAAIRRFIQYLSMQTGDIILLVRDAATGRILVKPPEEELWLLREKSGIGRAAKNEWNVLEEVGPDFFKKMDDTRRWHFGFPDYYDVYVWDATPGLSFHSLYCYVQEVSSFDFPSVRVTKRIWSSRCCFIPWRKCSMVSHATRRRFLLVQLAFADFIRLSLRHIASAQDQISIMRLHQC